MTKLPPPDDVGTTADALAAASTDPILAAVLDALGEIAPPGSTWEIGTSSNGNTYSVTHATGPVDNAMMLTVQSVLLAGVMAASPRGTGWTFDIPDGNTGIVLRRIGHDDEAVA